MILLVGCGQGTPVEEVEDTIAEETTAPVQEPYEPDPGTDGARGERPSDPSDKAKAAMKAIEKGQEKVATFS